MAVAVLPAAELEWTAAAPHGAEAACMGEARASIQAADSVLAPVEMADWRALVCESGIGRN